MPILGALILVLIAAIPILPSGFLTLLSALALKRKQKFLYFNSAFAAICNIILLSAFLLTYSVVTRGQRREDLWVLLAIVPPGLISSGGAFLLGYIGYKWAGSPDGTAATLPRFPLWGAVTAIFIYSFLLILSLVQRG